MKRSQRLVCLLAALFLAVCWADSAGAAPANKKRKAPRCAVPPCELVPVSPALDQVIEARNQPGPDPSISWFPLIVSVGVFGVGAFLIFRRKGQEETPTLHGDFSSRVSDALFNREDSAEPVDEFEMVLAAPKRKRTAKRTVVRKSNATRASKPRAARPSKVQLNQQPVESESGSVSVTAGSSSAAAPIVSKSTLPWAGQAPLNIESLDDADYLNAFPSSTQTQTQSTTH